MKITVGELRRTLTEANEFKPLMYLAMKEANPLTTNPMLTSRKRPRNMMAVFLKKTRNLVEASVQLITKVCMI